MLNFLKKQGSKIAIFLVFGLLVYLVVQVIYLKSKLDSSTGLLQNEIDQRQEESNRYLSALNETQGRLSMWKKMENVTTPQIKGLVQKPECVDSLMQFSKDIDTDMKYLDDLRKINPTKVCFIPGKKESYRKLKWILAQTDKSIEYYSIYFDYPRDLEQFGVMLLKYEVSLTDYDHDFDMGSFRIINWDSEGELIYAMTYFDGSEIRVHATDGNIPKLVEHCNIILTRTGPFSEHKTFQCTRFDQSDESKYVILKDGLLEKK